MRKYISGFIMGIVLMSGITYADDIRTSIMDCTVWVNGGLCTSINDPILNYNGKSYVPLRTFGEAVGITVGWDDASKSINLNYSPRVETKEVVKEVPVEKIEYKYVDNPKEVIKEVSNNPMGKFGKLTIALGESGGYICTDNDSNGNGFSFAFGESGLVGFKRINGTIMDSYIYAIKSEPTNNKSSQSQNSNSQELNKPSSSSIVAPLKIYSSDSNRLYLGTLMSSVYDSESIFNIYGTYGSKYSLNSIWNTYGTYGSKYSLYSAFNDYTTSAPIIVDGNGNIVGRLTTNKFTTGAVSPYVAKDLAIKLGL